jgi:hypothetical protein
VLVYSWVNERVAVRLVELLVSCTVNVLVRRVENQ